MNAKTVKRLVFWTIGIVVGLFVTIEVGSRIVFANALHYKDAIEKKISAKIHKPVMIHGVHATWYGFKPVLKLKDVDVLSDDKTHTIAHVDKLFLDIDLINTVLNHKLYRISGRVSGFSIQAFQVFPGIDHLNSQFNFNTTSGTLHLDSNESVLKAPEVFREPLSITRLIGDVSWQKKNDVYTIKIDDLSVNTPQIAMHADGSIELNPKDKSPLVDLKCDFQDSDIASSKKYFPAAIMKPKLLSWLDDAFRGGEITQGSLVLQGHLDQFPFDQGEGTFLITAHAEHVNLNYKNDWPLIHDINADVKFENRRFSMVADHGVVLGETFRSANASIPDLAKPVLRVNGRVKGRLEKGLAFIHQSPLEKGLGRRLAPLQLGGPMKLGLHMSIPLDHSGKKIHVLGSVQCHNSNLTVPDWRVSVEKLSGRFKFDEHSVDSQWLNGAVSGDPVKLRLATTKMDGKNQLQVAIKGVLNNVAAQNIVPIPLMRFVTGKSSFTAELRLNDPMIEVPDTFELTSNLEGMAIRLPKPLEKKDETLLPLTVSIKMKQDKPMLIDVDMENKLQLALKMQHKKLMSAKIHLGEGADVTLPKKDGMIVDGQLSEFDTKQWLAVMYLNGHQKTALPRLLSMNLSFKKFIVLGQLLHDVHLAVNHQNNANVVTLRSLQMNGDIKIPDEFPSRAIDVNIDRFHFYKKKTIEKSLLEPKDLPPINITINDFAFEKLPLGRFELSMTPEKNSLKINKLSFKSKIMSLSASGTWDEYDDFQKTVLSGALYTHNLGRMLTVFDITNNVMEGDGRALFSLHWPDSLLNYDLSKLNGRVNLEFQSGQIVKLSDATNAKVGLARVLNLFSLQSLPRRLALDFSDLTKDGFVFDDFSGHFTLQNGNAFTRDTTMEGSVAGVNLKGRLGLKSKDYQLSLLITPHVTSSLPVVATVAGGPVAGITTWVVEKIFRRAVNKVTTVKYHVSGPWEHPRIMKVQNSFSRMRRVHG